MYFYHYFITVFEYLAIELCYSFDIALDKQVLLLTTVYHHHKYVHCWYQAQTYIQHRRCKWPGKID